MKKFFLVLSLSMFSGFCVSQTSPVAPLRNMHVDVHLAVPTEEMGP